MDGFSDWPYRSICRQLGSAISYTEFVKDEDVLAGSANIAEKLAFEEDERPIAFQLYGDDPAVVLEAALRAQALGPDIIDINMGCPSKTIANRGAGVGLMRTPLKVARMFRALTASLEIPVTAKLRLGWDHDCDKYKLVARIIEESGGALIAIHGRTKKQGYWEQANWEAIAEVKRAVKIPVIGNGDVKTVADIDQMLAQTNCDGVMIGRAAIGNPWIFSRLDRDQVQPEQVRKTIVTHLERNLKFYGADLGLVLFRKHAARYLSPYRLPKKVRKKFLTCKEPGEFLALFDELNSSMPRSASNVLLD
jgi:nifR3 family TIM-barrel protein